MKFFYSLLSYSIFLFSSVSAITLQLPPTTATTNQNENTDNFSAGLKSACYIPISNVERKDCKGSDKERGKINGEKKCYKIPQPEISSELCASQGGERGKLFYIKLDNETVSTPTTLQSNSDLVYTYIQLANTYLWDIMIFFLFALIVWMGFKVMTNKAGSDEAKNVLKNGLMAAFTGILIILFSYVVVRLLINLF